MNSCLKQDNRNISLCSVRLPNVNLNVITLRKVCQTVALICIRLNSVPNRLATASVNRL